MAQYASSHVCTHFCVVLLKFVLSLLTLHKLYFLMLNFARLPPKICFLRYLTLHELYLVSLKFAQISFSTLKFTVIYLQSLNVTVIL